MSWVTAMQLFWGSPEWAVDSRVMATSAHSCGAVPGSIYSTCRWHQAVRSHHDNDHLGYPKDESVNHICELNIHSYSADFCPYHRIQFTQLNIFDQVWPLESDSVTNRESGQLGASIPHDIAHSEMQRIKKKIKKTLKRTQTSSLGVLTRCLNKSLCKPICWFSYQ